MPEPKPGALSDYIDSIIAEGAEKGLDRVRSILAMRMQQYDSMDFTDAEARSIAKSFVNIELGSATNLVMICSKEKCLYRNRCELYTTGNMPIGK